MSNLRHVLDGLKSLPCQDEVVGRRDELSDACQDALLGAERIARIVQDVRVFARVDEPPRDRVELRRVVEYALSMVAESLRAGIRLERDFHEVPAVLGSDHALGQVLLNLLVNAVHALKGRPHPVVRVGLRRWGEGRVAVEVQDNGCGIPKENLGRLFEPFFTTKPVGTGTGLGLSICHGIVTRLGGDIQVESTAQQGTLFRVVLPEALGDALSHPTDA